MSKDRASSTIFSTHSSFNSSVNKLNFSARALDLAQNNPKPIEYVGIDDKFGESGKPEDLMVKYGLKSQNIVHAVEKVIKRK